ncbi:CdaR family protein [Ammoniphilus resinae]|uniref:YbbR domain-containing protein n=1 Tax=Ammoniphilus resinae TaxID=861532 RepID=A0ABS4GS22_9BACL|nr:CdaR family protein [Ammoniphilus resinae]MBP1933078.1 YbbR domain-containing protein [Ammoniphilus resinae]
MDKWLRNNNVVKVVALFLAIGLWYVVNGGLNNPPQEYKQAIETYRISEVSLTAKFDQEHYVLVKIPKSVTVELKGTPVALSRNITPSDYEVYVDLSNVGKGTHTVPVQAKGFPKDLTVQIIPQRVDVTLEEKHMIEKEVTPEFVGKIPDGYTKGEAIIKPKKVHITLPESKMKEVAAVQAVIHVEGAKELVKATVPLRAVNSKGVQLDAEINPAVVEVTVPITSPYKVLPMKLEYINEPPPGVSIDDIQLKTDKITVYGPVEVIEKMNYFPGPKIDLSTLREDRYLQLKVPSVPNIIKTDPEFIEVEVRVSRAGERTFENVPIHVNGLGKDLQAVITDPDNGTISLTVKGAIDKLDELREDDIELYVDVSNLPEGEHEVEINMNLPPFITVDTTELKATLKIEGNQTEG